MKADIRIPPGWRRVTRGKVRAGDRVLVLNEGGAAFWSLIHAVEIEESYRYGTDLDARLWGVVIRRETK